MSTRSPPVFPKKAKTHHCHFLIRPTCWEFTSWRNHCLDFGETPGFIARSFPEISRCEERCLGVLVSGAGSGCEWPSYSL
jgi:hypothetical protein